MWTKLICIAGLLLLTNSVFAQEFGRNKARYKKLEFSVLESPDFRIYHYLDNPALLIDYADWAEQWYQMHQQVLKDTFDEKNPLILYNNHADFQQTSAIEGMIGIGTGGVTEGLRNRVVMPFSMSGKQNHHVLGHELVHAFQYHKLIHSKDSTISLKSIRNLPLWMVEGLAEYMSVGRVDPHTAMWMRDAVIKDEIPRVKKLDNPEYFPYRYGQAFWAFLTGVYGDDIIEPFFMGTAKWGLKAAIDSVLNTSEENLSSMWESALKTWYKQISAGTDSMPAGESILDRDNAGTINISPALSPNGKYIIFLSEKDVFTIDLFLANATTGEVIRKVASTVRDGHLDAFNFIESAGSWSPDSRQFAFVAFDKGKNVLVIKDVRSGKTVSELALDGVPAFSNPAWSPDGKQIVVSGLVEGQVDLYSIDLASRNVFQITDDRYSELLPSWSADGQYLVYSTDQLSMEKSRKPGGWSFNLCIRDMKRNTSRHLSFFEGANNMNPVFDLENNIWFLSDRDGFRNLYQYDTRSGKLYQITHLATGISGITPYSPAITIGGEAIAYSHYYKGDYSIYRSRFEGLPKETADPGNVDFAAATLPPALEDQNRMVQELLGALGEKEPLPVDSFTAKPYKPRFSLEYVGGQAGVGVGTQTFGTATAMQGGVDFLFGDVLGNNRLYTGFALNGEIYDAAAQVAYLNQKNRLGWGGSISHIPYRSATFSFVGLDTLQTATGLLIPVGKYFLDNYRLFEDKLSIFAQMPFSQTFRIEGGLAYSRIYFRFDRFTNYYDEFGRLIAQEREKQPSPPGFGYLSSHIGLVKDNSFFGVASPLQGHRYRLGAEYYLGDLSFFNVTADYRKYFYMNPVSLAFRIMHVGRYGRDAEVFSPLFLGYPWLVRGYSIRDASAILAANKLSVNQLVGTKMLVSNLELRIPFTGPDRLSLIKSKYFLTELNLFVDGGMAWSQASSPEAFERIGNFEPESQVMPVFSSGVSVRVNVLGAVILEPYLAVPLQRETKIIFGLNFTPGW